MLMEHDEIIQVLTETEARSKSNTKRINELAKSYEAINKMATAMEVMANEQKHQTQDIKGLKSDVDGLGQRFDALEAEPGKRWKKVADYILTALLGAAATLLVIGIRAWIGG